MILGEVFSNCNSKHLLVYIMKEKQNKAVSMIDIEAKGLVQNRNTLCYYKKNLRLGTYQLPPMIKDEKQCGFCFSKDLCCTTALSFNSYCAENEKPTFKYFKEMENTLDEK